MESGCLDETAHVQDVVDLYILCMLEDTFSLETAHKTRHVQRKGVFELMLNVQSAHPVYPIIS